MLNFPAVSLFFCALTLLSTYFFFTLSYPAILRTLIFLRTLPEWPCGKPVLAFWELVLAPGEARLNQSRSNSVQPILQFKLGTVSS